MNLGFPPERNKGFSFEIDNRHYSTIMLEWTRFSSTSDGLNFEVYPALIPPSHGSVNPVLFIRAHLFAWIRYYNVTDYNPANVVFKINGIRNVPILRYNQVFVLGQLSHIYYACERVDLYKTDLNIELEGEYPDFAGSVGGIITYLDRAQFTG